MYQLFLMAGGNSAEGAQQGNPYSSLLFIGAIILIFYFFMIRPGMKRQKEAAKFRNNLQEGSKIITTSGVYGKIIKIENNYIVLEIDNNVKIKIDKSAIATLQPNNS